jgi:hypothetical protein
MKPYRREEAEIVSGEILQSLHEKLQENIDDVKSVILSKTPKISTVWKIFDMSDI